MFVEQPLAYDDLAGLEASSRACRQVPIGADEGIHSLADIEAHERRPASAASRSS